MISGLLNSIVIKPFVEFNIFGMVVSVIFLTFLCSACYNVGSHLLKWIFIKAWISEIKVVQARVVSLSYKSNKKRKRSSVTNAVVSNPINKKSPEEFNVVLRSDRFKRLVIQNETLFDSIEDGDSFTLEYREKFEFFIFNPTKKTFVKLVPVRATLKSAEVISLS